MKVPYRDPKDKKLYQRYYMKEYMKRRRGVKSLVKTPLSPKPNMKFLPGELRAAKYVSGIGTPIEHDIDGAPIYDE